MGQGNKEDTLSIFCEKGFCLTFEFFFYHNQIDYLYVCLFQIYCHLVFQFKLQIEPDNSDNTGLNSFCLTCTKDGKEICSKKGSWGSWGESQQCAAGFSAADFKLQSQGGDDAAGILTDVGLFLLRKLLCADTCVHLAFLS